MKKLLLSLALFLSLTINTNAQTPHRHRYHRQVPAREYQHRPYRQTRVEHYPSTMGDFRLHVIGDIGTCDFGGLFWHRLPVHYTVGAMAEYQVGHATSLGLGAEFYSTYYRNPYYGYRDYLRSVPIYGNLRFSALCGPVRPFVEGRVGYALPLSSFAYGNQELRSGGLYTGGAVGLTIYGLNLSFGISAVDVMSYMPNYYVKDVIVDYSFRVSYAFGGSY